MKILNTSAKKCGCWSVILALSACAASAAIQVTYNVNMSVQQQLGNFNPANGDTVFVAGDFATTNGAWLQTATDGSTNYILTLVPGTTNYTGTFTVTNDPGTFENHQFVMNPGGNFAALMWEPNVIGGGNRFYAVPTVNTNLPIVFFNDVSNANQQVVESVTFQVDMSVQTTLGNFNANNGDIVLVAGNFNGFTAGSATLLSTNGTNANIWFGTCLVTNTPGATENYKFLFIPFSGNPASVWEVDGLGPNNAQNRQFLQPSSATNLGVVFFNNITNANSLVSLPTTFRVNMTVQHARGTFTPGVDTVTVAGNPLNNWAPTGSQLTNSVGSPDLYVGTFIVTNTVGSATAFKFVVNGGSGLGWESIANRQLVVPGGAPTNLPSVFYNNIGDLGKLAVSNNAGTATLKWTGWPNVRLQSSANLAGGWLNVPGTQGSNSLSTNITGQQFFRLNGP